MLFVILITTKGIYNKLKKKTFKITYLLITYVASVIFSISSSYPNTNLPKRRFCVNNFQYLNVHSSMLDQTHIQILHIIIFKRTPVN